MAGDHIALRRHLPRHRETVLVQGWQILVPAKAAVICSALQDFPPDSTPLGLEAGGVARLRRGFPKRENAGLPARGGLIPIRGLGPPAAGRGRKMPFMDGH